MNCNHCLAPTKERIWRPRTLVLGLFVMASLAAASAAQATIHLQVDASDSARKLLHAKLEFAVKAGPLTLLYPKYIPGEHGPTGPIENLAGLRFSAGGQTIRWQRDLLDMYTFHLVIPAGASSLEASLDFLSPTGSGDFTAGGSMTPDLLDLNWNQVLLYPAGAKAADITFAPSLRLPEGFQFATALTVAQRDAARVDFEPVSLETLVDSPLIAGRYFKEVDLSPPGGPPHFLDMVADGPEPLAIPAGEIEAHRRLIQEAFALFGARHYQSYHFLLTLSAHTAHFGLEHHQSSDDRTGPSLFLDADARLTGSGLLPHEFVHSWNGKFRRPKDLATPDYQVPMQTDLLWVYEGLTTYLGEVLSARSGLRSAPELRADLALTAARMSLRPGRSWRPLSDTTAAAQVLYQAPRVWQSWRRSTDFYPEGLLIWLEVDARLRKLSSDRVSIDDFTHAFHGPQPGKVAVLPYTFESLVATLEGLVHSDWGAFLSERLDSTDPAAPLGGLESAGWRLAFTQEPNPYLQALERLRHVMDLGTSIGLSVSNDGAIRDVVWKGPAFQAGLGPGMKLLAVNGRAFTPSGLRKAIAAALDEDVSIALLVQNEDLFDTHPIDYHAGLRYPHLVRIASEPDLLSEILAPHAQH